MLDPWRPLGREHGDRHEYWRAFRFRCRFHVWYGELPSYQYYYHQLTCNQRIMNMKLATGEPRDIA